MTQIVIFPKFQYSRLYIIVLDMIIKVCSNQHLHYVKRDSGSKTIGQSVGVIPLNARDEQEVSFK